MNRPHYDLSECKWLLARERKFRITKAAYVGAGQLGLDEEDIVECIQALDMAKDFYKTMPSAKHSGTHQDVYRTRYNGWPIYLKLQIVDGLVIISFKRDESV
jgi:motility quorum-sensing regulator/GCU-specific mRNA interferase toxin